jgi:hypothetical protein
MIQQDHFPIDVLQELAMVVEGTNMVDYQAKGECMAAALSSLRCLEPYIDA